MSMPTFTRRHAIAFALGVSTVAACRDPTLRPPPQTRYLLVEKGPYQSLYDEEGRIERLLYDRDDDGTADAIVLYDTNGNPRQAEIDTDLDDVIDRWEYFDNGILVRVGTTRHRRGAPDYWEVIGRDETPTRREFDDDGDGKVDRSEPVSD